MTSQELKSAAIRINQIIATNNPKGVTEALKREGYPTQFDIMSADDIEKALLGIYNLDPLKWNRIVSSVSYNPQVTNSSTTPEAKQYIINLGRNLNMPGSDTASASRFDFSGAIHWIGGLIAGTTVNNSNTVTSETQAQVKTGIVIFVTILVIGAILSLYFWGPRAHA